MYLSLDGQNWRHIWVVSDIHGCYQLLIQHLKRQKFDPARGGGGGGGALSDRGPESLKCLQLINEKWFCAVRGNHEQMALDAIESQAYALWLMNGGVWFAQLPEERKAHALALFNLCDTLPWVIDITCQSGLNVIVHADYPAAHYERGLPVDKHRLLWDRSRITDLMAGKEEGISGADHFWFGHTPLEKRIDFANLHYIDTGAVFGGTLTLAQLQ